MKQNISENNKQGIYVLKLQIHRNRIHISPPCFLKQRKAGRSSVQLNKNTIDRCEEEQT